MDGIWHCDCDTRLPAEKFQVKNGGKNHGRWFYTCQKPQTKRCNFFLWSDDAKIREEAAVLNNSKTEPGATSRANVGEGGRLRSDMETPRTPKRQTKITEPITPVSKPRPPPQDTVSPERSHDNTDVFDWSSSADEELAEFADSLDTDHLDREHLESPSKVARTPNISSPGKRSRREMKSVSFDEITSSGTWPLSDSGDVFATPSTSMISNDNSGLPSPGITPAQVRKQLFSPSHAYGQKDQPLSEEPSTLALEALSILSPLRPSLPSNIEHSLVTLLNKYEMKTQGISKGREIARLAVQAKEKKITELQQQVVRLEAEREMQKTVIQHLKTDIATSPKKPRRPNEQKTRRNEA